MDLVLDIDFDYCVRPTLQCGYADRSRQPSGLRLWLTPEDFTAWLAARGLLHRDSFAGAVQSHEQVLPIWGALIRSGTLAPPFTVLHVDAHPDMMDLDPEVERCFEMPDATADSLFFYAKSNDYLQFAVRLGWVARIVMLFPDDERERITALARGSAGSAARVVNKPVIRVGPGPDGGAELLVRVGDTDLPVDLHTRDSAPRLPRPTVTVLAHSPEFVPPLADPAFRRLSEQLGGPDHV